MTVNAMELDELLSRLTPGDRAAIRAAMPAEYRDRIESAHAQSAALMIATSGGLDAVRVVRSTDVDDWLRLGALDALIGWMTGKGSRCLHADPLMPQTVWAAAWKPGVVVCTACLDALSVADSVEDLRCDCCGRICDPETDGGFFALKLWVGELLYQAGACRDCYQHPAAVMSLRPTPAKKRPARMRNRRKPRGRR